MLSLKSFVSEIKGIGQNTAKHLKKLNIQTVEDLLYYFPFRYEDWTKSIPINQLQDDFIANVVGIIELIQNKKSAKKRMNITEALVNDGTASLKVIWFNQPFIVNNLKVGNKLSLAGKIEKNYGGLTMNSPIYEKVGKNKLIHTQGLVPIYHLTGNVTQKQIRYLISQTLFLAKNIKDPIPPETKQVLGKEYSLLSLNKALYKIHSPTSGSDIKNSQDKLAFDELFLLHTKTQLIRRDIKNSRAEPVKFKEKITKNFVANLTFQLTNAQRKASWEILQDLGKNHPMSRLLEGDVGSGKTVVATIALLNVSHNRKKQSVLMAPTEVLAGQHFQSLDKFLKKFNINIGLFTKSNKLTNQTPEEKKISKNKLITFIKNGDIDIIIGTHALIQEDVTFHNLNLAIIDEQHRFGVEQRKTLIAKSSNKQNMPHLLSMTATPIPRSLALALFGDLNISIIDELPANRKPIITKIVPKNKRNQAYDFIKNQLQEGKQAFVICPLIESSPKLEVQSVEEEYKKLTNNIFPKYRIAMMHGKLKPREKEKIMREFLENNFQILISTSVIEVGVDIPNATVMIIEGAERFGLSQLHQFRGRVSRGQHQSYCFLFTENKNEKTKQRLQSLVDHQDGFTLSKMDLKLRGSGDMYGTTQKGFPQLKVASLFDYDLMKKAQSAAKMVIENDPELKKYPRLAEKIKEEKQKIHLE